MNLPLRPLLLAALLLPALAPVHAQTSYTVDAAHSSIEFKVRHLGLSTVTGSFRSYEATVDVDPADLSTFRARASIDAASLDTGNDRRDEHLRSADFFDTANHPRLTFESRAVQNLEGNRFQVAGDLTIRGVTRPVVLDVVYEGTAVDMAGKRRLAFTASGTINRKDFGLTWNRAVEAGGLLVGEEVRLALDVQAVPTGV